MMSIDTKSSEQAKKSDDCWNEDHRKTRGGSEKHYNEIIVNEIISRTALKEICQKLKIPDIEEYNTIT